MPFYDGAALARRGVVAVTFNHRANIFGFFAHPEPSRESAQGTSGTVRADGYPRRESHRPSSDKLG